MKINLTDVPSYIERDEPKPLKKITPHCDKCGKNFDTITQKVRHKCA